MIFFMRITIVSTAKLLHSTATHSTRKNCVGQSKNKAYSFSSPKLQGLGELSNQNLSDVCRRRRC